MNYILQSNIINGIKIYTQIYIYSISVKASIGPILWKKQIS